MSPSDPKGGGAMPPVGEISLPMQQMPRNTETPQYPSAILGSTPGFALAGVRPPPGGPTLPELDALSLTNAISQLANTMFQAPAGASEPHVASAPHHADTSAYAEPPTAALASSPGVTPVAATPTTTHPAFEAPSTPSHAAPFGTALNFDAIMPMEQPSFSVPLHEGHAPANPHHPNYPSRTAQPDHPDHRYSFDTFEITPAHDPSVRSLGTRIFDPNVIKKEFPILSEPVRGKRLVWLDNAATTQKPRAVIDRLSYFYEHENSNIHRAAHTLAAKATDAYEGARETVRRFIHAPSKDEIIFVRGTTEGINLLSNTYGRRHVREGDEILITNLEHHANIVPWQMLCQEKGACLKVAPVDSKGAIILEEFEKLLSPRTRIVSITQVSNALGTITPAKDMIAMAHRHGAVAILDGAQSVSHMPVDVQDLDADFFVFSGHKVFGPTGIGAVFGKMELLQHMPPWQGGGNMIQDVTFERTRYQPPPFRFEAGTGNIADAVGLGAALDWVSRVGIHNIERYEHELLEYGTSALATVPGLTMIGTAPQKAGVLSFILDGQKTEEVGGLLDQEGIAVRSGHHCAQPILRRFGVEATVRASLAPYNTCEDIDALVAALHELQSGRR